MIHRNVIIVVAVIVNIVVVVVVIIVAAGHIVYIERLPFIVINRQPTSLGSSGSPGRSITVTSACGGRGFSFSSRTFGRSHEPVRKSMYVLFKPSQHPDLP